MPLPTFGLNSTGDASDQRKAQEGRDAANAFAKLVASNDAAAARLNTAAGRLVSNVVRSSSGIQRQAVTTAAPIVMTPSIAAAIRTYSGEAAARGAPKLYFGGDDTTAQQAQAQAAPMPATPTGAATSGPAPVLQSTELIGPQPSYYDPSAYGSPSPYASPYGLMVSPPAAPPLRTPVTSGVGPDWKTYAVPAAAGVGIVLLALIGIELARAPSRRNPSSSPSVRRIIASGRYRWADAVANGDRQQLEEVLGQIRAYAARPITRPKAQEMRDVVGALGYPDDAADAYRSGTDAAK